MILQPQGITLNVHSKPVESNSNHTKRTIGQLKTQ